MKRSGALFFVFMAMAAAQARAASCTDIPITFNAELYAAASIRFERDLHQAVSDVCKWWGHAFDGEIVVNVENDRKASTALDLAWKGKRGAILYNAKMVEAGRAVLHYEVAHVFAPNANRFLAEGLAVYAHELLGGAAGFPNNGQDLHAAAKPLAPSVDLAVLERINTPRRLETGDIDQRDAYIVAGSFVRFLIEEFGMAKFQRIYARTPLQSYERDPGDAARWSEIYGQSFELLAQKWLAYLLGFSGR